MRVRMVRCRRLLLGLAVASALAAPAVAQPQGAKKHAPPAPKPGTAAQYNTAAAPRTLAEALAATYANQPALQAERAKLRATDENVPQALAGWRPTVVMAGTAGYGDGMTRQ